MRVIGYSHEFCWYLLEDKAAKYFQILCTSTIARATVLIALNEAEIAQFQALGSPALDALSTEINASAPQRAESTSPFVSRNIESLRGREVYDAIMKWRSETADE